MNNWIEVSDEEMKLGMSIANLKKGELQIKYAKDLCRLNNIINELEKDVEKRLMSIPDDICDDALEETKRTTKIAVYQVVLGKLQELKGSESNE